MDNFVGGKEGKVRERPVRVRRHARKPSGQETNRRNDGGRDLSSGFLSFYRKRIKKVVNFANDEQFVYICYK